MKVAIDKAATLLKASMANAPASSASRSTLSDLRSNNKFKMATKTKKTKKAIADALKLANSLELDNDLDDV